MSSTKEYLTILGSVQVIDGERHFVFKSEKYYRDQLSRFPLQKEMQVTFSSKMPSRSGQQLRYHMVLMGYLAEYCGYGKEEMHDAVMRIKFGTKTIVLDGKEVEVRKSISNHGKLGKAEVVELIEYDLELAQKMGVKIPTMEELGYIAN